MEPIKQKKPQFTGMKEFRYREPGNWFTAELIDEDELTGDEIYMPPWLDMSHPNFPKYFELAIFNKDGAPCWLLQRIAKPSFAPEPRYYDTTDDYYDTTDG